MSISFKEIGGDIRVPLTYIEFDNSNAVSGTPAPRQRVLMFGQCAMTGNNPVGTAPLNTPVRVFRLPGQRGLWRGSCWR